jgi:hypothetical protein
VDTVIVPMLRITIQPVERGANIADNNVHNHTPGGEGGKQDNAMHHGLCNAGMTTTADNCE